MHSSRLLRLFSHFALIFRARLVAAEDHPKPQSRSDSPQNAHAGPSTEKVVVDPMKGGAVSPKTAGSQSKALGVHPGQWIWDGLVNVLEVDIFSPAWEVRHGAAMALRELLKAQGKYGGTKGLSLLYLSSLSAVNFETARLFSWSETRRERHYP